MTIKREYYNGPITFVCDECGWEENTGCFDFTDALAEFKDTGGRITKEDGQWEHRCADCA